MPTNKLTPEIIHAAIAGFEQQKHSIDIQIADLKAMLPGSRTEPAATPEAAHEAQGLCRRTSPDGSRTAEAVGSDQRDNRVAVIASYAGTRKTETQAECRWQGQHRGGIAEEAGSEEGGGTSGGEEIGGKGRSGEKGGEEVCHQESDKESSGKEGGEGTGTDRTRHSVNARYATGYPYGRHPTSTRCGVSDLRRFPLRCPIHQSEMFRETGWQML